MSITIHEDKRKLRCLVTGGTGALGSSVCRLLAEDDCRIAFTFHERADVARALESELPGSAALQCDVRDFEATSAAVQQAADLLGGLDVLVHALGISGDPVLFRKSDAVFDRLEAADMHALDEVLAVNSRGAYAVCRAARPFLRERGGNIVVVGSMDGIKLVPSPVHFAASKSFLKGMVESLAAELGRENIRVNLIAPGILDGGQSTRLPAALKEHYLKFCSLGRFGTMQEIAEVIAFFALENTYITGQSILLDGGL